MQNPAEHHAPVLTSPAFLASAPKQAKRPCDYGLELAVRNLEIQLGSIEAYNRLAGAAGGLLAKIKAGEVTEPVPGTANPAQP